MPFISMKRLNICILANRVSLGKNLAYPTLRELGYGHLCKLGSVRVEEILGEFGMGSLTG
jgi:hypothetical protein